MRRANESSGQALVITVLALMMMLGLCALVIDVGSWFHAKRQLQATVDASVLAGAQGFIPGNPTPGSLAGQYATLNPPTGAIKISFPDSHTINVHSTLQAPAFFAKAVGIDSVGITAESQATVLPIVTECNARPIAISQDTLSGFGFGTNVVLDADVPGGYSFVNLDGTTKNAQTKTLADWIRNGYDPCVERDEYFSTPGVKGSSDIKDALDAVIGQTLVFPVYDFVVKQGGNAYYNVVGWTGFVLTGYDTVKGKYNLHGYFKAVSDPDSEGDPSAKPYGAFHIQLTDCASCTS